MHDPKFEKAVQQKMEGLEFAPPEAVWLKVERAINPAKRRRAPLFWLFFLAGGVLLGGAGIFLATRKNGSVALNKTNAGAVITGKGGADAVANGGQAETPAGGAGENAGQRNAGLQKGQKDGKDNNGIEKKDQQLAGNDLKRSGTESQKGESGNAAVRGGEAVNGNGVEGNSSVTGMARAKNKSGRNNDKPGRVGDDGGSVDENAAGSAKDLAGAESGQNGHSRKGNTAGEASENAGANPKDVYRPGMLSLTPVPAEGAGDIGGAFRKINARKAVSKLNTIPAANIQKIQPKYNRSWEAGFAGGAGSSSMNQALFERTTINAMDARPSTGTAVQAAAPPPPKVSSSKVMPFISFWAGITVQKHLNERLSLTSGLNLHYYSTRIRTGEQVQSNTNLLTANSYFYAAAPAAAPLPPTPYYPVGTDKIYLNRYYFLELPVAVQWQLNKSKMLPLFWEGGLTLSYLMSSDGLYYNVTDNAYYKDGTVVNRTQINAATALMVGIPVMGLRLQAGPQLQYGLTRVLNERATGDGHMFFAGLKLVVMPGKGKK